MLGYVRAEKPEMKVKEFEVYNGYYCGVCKSIGDSYGQLPRLSLSYDAAFLAALIDGLCVDIASVSSEHCIVHPIKKKTIIRSDAVDYAADVMLLLGYHKLEDDYLDEKSKKAFAAKKVFSKSYEKLARSYRKLDKAIKAELEALHRLEKSKEGNLDKIAHHFAKIMEETVTFFFAERGLLNEMELRVLARVGYMLGKWIYLIDALDDFLEDIEKGCYNPIIYKYELTEELFQQNRREYLANIRDLGERNLFLYGSDLMSAVDLLEMKKNKAIIDNIIGMGLLRRAEEVLENLK